MTDRYRQVLSVPVQPYNNLGLGTDGVDLLVDEMNLYHLVLRTGSGHVTLTRPELRALARGITAYLDEEEALDGKARPTGEVQGPAGKAQKDGVAGDAVQRGIPGDTGDHSLESPGASRGDPKGEGSKAKALAEALTRLAFPGSFPPNQSTPSSSELVGQARLFMDELTK